MPPNGPSSNKSTSSTSSSSSGSVSASATSSHKNKARRQTIATLAAAAAASRQPAPNQPPASSTSIDLQRNLVALAQQFSLNKAAAAAAAAAANNSVGVNNENIQQPQQPVAQTATFDQIIQEMTLGGDKAKLLTTHTPKVSASKHIKKQHLLSASLNASPNSAASPNGLNAINPTAQKVPKGR